MSATYEHVKNFYLNRKSLIIYVMGDKCACCGYNKCNSALEFHHLNPKEKRFMISSNVNRKWEDIVEELPKTIMVCANCHREIHAGIINNDELKSNFDEERAKIATEQVNKQKYGRKKYCKNCGKVISSKATYCPDCYGKTQRRTEWPSREELKKDIRSMPMTQVGKKYGVTDNAIRKWCDQYGLPRKSTVIKSISDEEWETI